MKPKCKKCPKTSETYAKCFNIYECEIVCSKMGIHNHPLCKNCYNKEIDNKIQSKIKSENFLNGKIYYAHTF